MVPNRIHNSVTRELMTMTFLSRLQCSITDFIAPPGIVI
jgi:hypothetical protein